jgi:hypothetical protein
LTYTRYRDILDRVGPFLEVEVSGLLVVGSAPCALEDLEKAQALYPFADVMLVNGACTLVKNAEHLVAGHTGKAEEFVAARKRAFPNAGPIHVHANWASKRRASLSASFPSVTHWWEGDVSSGATSAGKAALIGIKMGFWPIILCGCPMDGSGYHPDEGTLTKDPSCQRIGDPKMQERRTIKRYRERMANLAQTTFLGQVFSMSGFTRMVLGAPPMPPTTPEWLE